MYYGLRVLIWTLHLSIPRVYGVSTYSYACKPAARGKRRALNPSSGTRLIDLILHGSDWRKSTTDARATEPVSVDFCLYGVPCYRIALAGQQDGQKIKAARCETWQRFTSGKDLIVRYYSVYGVPTCLPTYSGLSTPICKPCLACPAGRRLWI